VAVAAVFPFVAIDTAESEEDDMLFMIESHYRSFLKGGMISSLFRLGYDRVGDTHNIGGVHSGAGQRFSLGGSVTDDALGIMTPLAMTAHTLAVIGPFETGLTEIGGIGLSPMAVFARLNLVGGTVMMAGTAVAAHLGHPGMNLMIEFDRLIKVGQVIKQH
jgi:hypothetical protein